jgi:serine/threonine-protein kinase
VLGAEHPELASTLFNLGISRRELKDLEGALAYFRRALSLDEKAHGPDHPNVAFTLIGLGTLYRDLGRLDEAEAAFRRAGAILDRELPGHPAHEELAREWGELKNRRHPALRAPGP